MKVNKIAKKHNPKTMIVCMFGSSLAVAPAYVLALDGATYNNIEVPKIMLDDRKFKIECHDQLIYAPNKKLWG